MSDEQEIIIVHTGESRTLRYNPLVHGELHQEMPDGDMLLSVVSLESLAARERALKQPPPSE